MRRACLSLTAWPRPHGTLSVRSAFRPDYSRFFAVLFILVKFPKLGWFAFVDLFLQVQQLLDEVCLESLI